MNRMHLAAALLLILAGSGCTAASSFMKDSAPTAPPGPDVAKVVFYRTPAYMGNKSAYDVWDGDKLAGMAENGGYFEYLCPPGRHLFHVIAPLLAGDAAVEADLAGGKTYFIRAHVGVGLEPTPARTPDERRKRDDDFGRTDCRELRPEKATGEALARDREQARKQVEELKGPKADRVRKMAPDAGE
jgi:hypothetical protein